MRFQHDAEHEMLRDSVATALERGARDGAPWGPLLGAQGALALMVPESLGGTGLGMAEGVVVCAEAGRHCVDYPLAETMLAAPAVIAAAPQVADDLLAGRAAATAAMTGGVEIVSGRIVGTVKVGYADMAEWLAVPAGERGVAVLRLAGLSPAPRVAVEPDVALCVIAIDAPENRQALVPLALFEARLAVLRCADLAGAAGFCFDTAVDYLKQRRQFGQPIGANQALKHMAADCFVRLENMKIAVDYAAAALDSALARPDDPAAGRAGLEAVDVMLSLVPEAALDIAETAIQFHGGIGVTWEYKLNRYLRRILRINMAFRPAADHRRALLAGMMREDHAGRTQGSFDDVNRARRA